MVYSDTLLAYFRRSDRAGVFASDTPDVVGVRVGNPRRGGVIALQVRLDTDGSIEDSRFQAHGCGATIAVAAWLGDWLPGRTLEQAAALHDAQISTALELPPAKLHCAVLAVAAARALVTARPAHGALEFSGGSNNGDHTD